MKKLLVGVILAMGFAAPSTAQAYPDLNDWVNFYKARDVAQQFWAQRGVHALQGWPNLNTSYNLGQPQWVGLFVNNTIWIRSDVLDANGPSSRRYMCMYVTHEYGHAGGLGHTTSGLMTEGLVTTMPYNCQLAF